MIASTRAAVVGCGYRFPARSRGNDDPVYDSIHRGRNPQGVKQTDVFRDLQRRYYLSGQESATDLAVGACRQALTASGIAAHEIDRLYGYVSVPRYYAPNDLYLVHQALGLSTETVVVPINGEFTNFLSGLWQAAEAVTSGRAGHCLVAVANDWTRHVDYTQGHALAISDAAGAAVVGRGDRFVVLDEESWTFPHYFHALTMGTRAVTTPGGQRWLPLDPVTGQPSPTLEINQTGLEVIGSVYKDALPELVNTLLARNEVRADQTALITHQGVRTLLDHWADRIQPKEYVDTLGTFGNMVNATYAVNLAHCYDKVTTDFLVLAGLGPGVHVTAVLIQV